MEKKCKTGKNGKGKFNKRNKQRKKMVKRWFREIRQKYIYSNTFLLIY